MRIAPDELNYTTASALRSIYGARAVEMPRANDGRGEIAPPPVNGVEGMLTATHDNHARMRRALLPAFSDRSLREQEPVVQNYVTQLIDGLRKHVGHEPVDFTQWLMWTSFDIIGDLGLC